MSSSIAVLLPPLLPVTDNDHGAWVITVSTILLIITILATTVTLISRIRVLRKISWSDSTLFLSCVSAFAFNDCYFLINPLDHIYSSDCLCECSQFPWYW